MSPRKWRILAEKFSTLSSLIFSLFYPPKMPFFLPLSRCSESQIYCRKVHTGCGRNKYNFIIFSHFEPPSADNVLFSPIKLQQPAQVFSTCSQWTAPPPPLPSSAPVDSGSARGGSEGRRFYWFIRSSLSLSLVCPGNNNGLRRATRQCAQSAVDIGYSYNTFLSPTSRTKMQSHFLKHNCIYKTKLQYVGITSHLPGMI